MYNVQMYVLDSIFGRICHPFLKYEQNTYTYEQHGSLMSPAAAAPPVNAAPPKVPAKLPTFPIGTLIPSPSGSFTFFWF